MSDYIDTGHDNHDLEAGHEAHGSEHDSLHHFQALEESHAHEVDQHYVHAYHAEYDDGHGGHYSVTDYTEYDNHEVSTDNVEAEQYTDQDHSESFNEIEFLHEHFNSELGQYGHEGGQEGGQQQLSAVSN
jgi:hypothetical protein